MLRLLPWSLSMLFDNAVNIGMYLLLRLEAFLLSTLRVFIRLIYLVKVMRSEYRQIDG